MTNAKQEFLDHISERCVGGRTVRCAQIKLYNAKNKVEAILPVGYTPEDLEEFLKEINLEYNDGYGGQNLYGTIWYNDGVTWSSRFEYNGSECWDFNEIPEITPELLGDPDSRV
jgi:hypothetical protein